MKMYMALLSPLGRTEILSNETGLMFAFRNICVPWWIERGFIPFLETPGGTHEAIAKDLTEINFVTLHTFEG